MGTVTRVVAFFTALGCDGQVKMRRIYGATGHLLLLSLSLSLSLEAPKALTALKTLKALTAL